MKKRLFALFLALVMALGLTATTWADEPVTGVSYVDEKGEEQLYTGTYTEITESNKPDEWITGWYVVRGNVEINYDNSKVFGASGYEKIVVVTGDAHLILCDGAKLTVRMDNNGDDVTGIYVKESGSLTIYGQTSGSGLLSVTSNRNEGGIDNFGTLTINGGTVTANGTENSDGISNYDTLTINNGTVTANGAGGGGGINSYGDNNRVTITGGTVKATGGKYGGQAVRILNNGKLTLPTTYWWRTETGGAFTKCVDENTAYTPNEELYAELTTTRPEGWVEPTEQPEDQEQDRTDGSSVHQPIRRQHVTAVEDTTTTDTTTDVVTSAKTFDTGVAVYGAMAIASLLGMGYVGKKRV